MKLVALWGPVVLVMALIYFASDLPDPGTPPGGLSDKAAHFVVYGSLGAALMRALAGGRTSRMTIARLVAATLIAALYGLSDEFHQSFVPGRTPDWKDLAADAAGALAGAAVVALVARAVALAQRRFPPSRDQAGRR